MPMRRVGSLLSVMTLAACSGGHAGSATSSNGGSHTGTTSTTSASNSASASSASAASSSGNVAATIGGGSTGTASGSSGSTGTTNGSSSGSSTSSGAGFTPAAHRQVPPLQGHGGGSMPGLTLVAITASNDATADQLQDFSTAMVTSQWVRTVLAPYGISPPAGVIHVTNGPAITSALDSVQVEAYIEALISGNQAPAPNGSNLYLLYIPAAGSLASTGFVGYHAAFPSRGTSLGDSYATAEEATPAEGQSVVDTVTVTASHELAEAATDPLANGFFIGPSSDEPWTTSAWATLQSGHIEAGDLCEGTVTIEAAGDAGYFYQRIYDAPLAADGGDPACIPFTSTPYFSTSASQDWYAGQPGQTVQIPFTGWSSAATSNWLIYVDPIEQSADLDGGMGTPEVTTSLGRGSAAGCLPRQALNNGASGTVSVTIPDTAVPGDWASFRIDSFYEGAGPSGCEQSGLVDLNHRWMVGVYVPFPDAGPSPTPALPASPISCDRLAAAFGADGNLYEICGDQPDYGTLDQMQVYSPATQTWSSAPTPPLPVSANFGGAAGPDGRIYLVDGVDDGVGLAALGAYDPVVGTWDTLPAPAVARADIAALFGPDGRLYVIGGWSGSEPVASVERYDLDAGWTTGADLPQAVALAGAAVGADGRIYVFGGEAQLPDGGDYSSDLVQVLDVSSGAWSTWPIALPVARQFGTAVADSAGNIYLFGGDTNGVETLETDILLSDGGWLTDGAPLPVPRRGLAGALGPDGEIYAVGGELESGLVTGALNTLSPACGCWSL